MLIGYARVSTDDQHLDNQRSAFRAAGCKRIYEEKISGVKRNRPELTKLLDHLREGDPLGQARPCDTGFVGVGGNSQPQRRWSTFACRALG